MNDINFRELRQRVADFNYENLWRKHNGYRKNKRFTLNMTGRLIEKRKADQFNYDSNGKRLKHEF